jgi:hypothetical protein
MRGATNKIRRKFLGLQSLRVISVCMSVPVVMGVAEQILTQHALLVVRVLSLVTSDV